MQYLKFFKELSKNDTHIAGGKGASLGEMFNVGIPVPNGYVVTANAFEHFLTETGLRDQIQEILSKVDSSNVSSIEDASQKIRLLITTAEIPEAIIREVEDAQKELDADFVAVRSSATAEDGAEHAWAGQLESYLNVSPSDVLTRVRESWASLFTSRAIFYRFEKNLADTLISVAVVVQKMVNSEKSGIAFSVHPVTEDYNQMIIEAGFGLGEAIVSGSITPDAYVVTKEPKEIIDINVGTQNKALYRGKDGGNVWKDLSSEKAQQQVLSEEEILELADIIVQIENHYGFPSDIEWAYEEGKFYIVQSRPITTLKPKEEEIFENEYLNKYKFSLLAEDFNSPYFRNYIWARATFIFEKELQLPKPIWGIISHKNNIEYVGDLKNFSEAHEVLKKRVEQNIYYVEQNLIDKTNETGELFNQWSEKNIYQNNLGELGDEEILGLYKTFIEKQATLYAYGLSLPVLDFGDFAFVEGNLKRILEKYTSSKSEYLKYYSLFTEPIEDTFSQDQEFSLLKIIQKYEDDEDWIRDIKKGDLSIIEKNHPAFWEEIKDHTEKYKWLYYVFIGPAFTEGNFIEFIQQELKSEKTAKEKIQYLKKKKEEVERKKKEFVQEHPSLSEFEKVILYIAGKMVWAKPRRKDYQSKSYFHLEKLLKEIAKRTTSTLDDIRSLPVELLEKSLQEKKIDKETTNKVYEKHVLLPRTDGGIDLFTEKEADRVIAKMNIKREVVLKEGDLMGTTAYPGKVTGRVKIINTPKEMHKMNEGDILVSVATTPSIVPVMRKAAAIVTNEGGLTCHAAIVSRELEIPCVVGLKNATQVLHDGDLVEVDADNGVVRVLEKNEDMNNQKK